MINLHYARLPEQILAFDADNRRQIWRGTRGLQLTSKVFFILIQLGHVCSRYLLSQDLRKIASTMLPSLAVKPTCLRRGTLREQFLVARLVFIHALKYK